MCQTEYEYWQPDNKGDKNSKFYSTTTHYLIFGCSFINIIPHLQWCERSIRLCMPLFKQPLISSKKSVLWSEKLNPVKFTCVMPHETDVIILYGSSWRGKKKLKKGEFCLSLQVGYSTNGIVLGFTKKKKWAMQI